MAVLDAGTVSISNVDVLKWIDQKRKQHAEEDAEDRAAGRETTRRPKHYMTALKKHERHLKSSIYPYARNPTAYNPDTQYDSMRRFEERVVEEVIMPLEENYRGEDKNDAKLSKEQEEKALTEPELLMIHNHAPKNEQMLQPMLENGDERFTEEEQRKIVDCVWEVYRSEETRPED